MQGPCRRGIASRAARGPGFADPPALLAQLTPSTRQHALFAAASRLAAALRCAYAAALARGGEDRAAAGGFHPTAGAARGNQRAAAPISRSWSSTPGAAAPRPPAQRQRVGRGIPDTASDLARRASGQPFAAHRARLAGLARGASALSSPPTATTRNARSTPCATFNRRRRFACWPRTWKGSCRSSDWPTISPRSPTSCSMQPSTYVGYNCKAETRHRRSLPSSATASSVERSSDTPPTSISCSSTTDLDEARAATLCAAGAAAEHRG